MLAVTIHIYMQLAKMCWDLFCPLLDSSKIMY